MADKHKILKINNINNKATLEKKLAIYVKKCYFKNNYLRQTSYIYD